MLGFLSRVPVGAQKGVARGLLIAAGVILLYGVLLPVMVFTETTETKTSGHLWWKKETTTAIPLTDRVPFLLLGIGAFTVAVVCFVAAVTLFTTQGRLKKYLAILVGVESLGIERIAAITGSSTTRVYADLSALISSGMIDDFYLDHEAEQVVSRRYVPKRSHKVVATCSGCGGSNEVIVGITRSCSFCEQPLRLQKR